jgi:hypothetical protein
MERLLADFSSVRVKARGTDVAAICNKLIVIFLRSVERTCRFNLISAIVGLLFVPLLPWILLVGHIAIRAPLGSEDDPLGYTAVGLKST